MSLYFEERMIEQKENDPSNGKIVFTHPWILTTIPLQNENDEVDENVHIHLQKFLHLHSEIPHGFLTRFYNAFQNRTALKAVIFFEITTSEKLFNRPFEHPLHPLNKKTCEEYPKAMENDFRFEFLKNSDYTIKCPDDYSMQAIGMVLNFSSEFMRKHFKESKENEFICEHRIDVIKPIIIYIHSLCFQMPKTYDLDFVDRLLEAIHFFELENESDIKKSIHKSICQKLVEEPSNNFHSVLQFLSIAIKHGFKSLCNMCSALIANKFYQQWEQTFPPNARNPNNLLFREIFGPEGHIDLENEKSLTLWCFDLIEFAIENSFFTNIILQ
uniref:BTB domain-containing protein n=1 Tax=Panagrolaimus davidi TaxID=227884 RepID=A0A914QEP5_9BILA